jgi:hypothetical protein
MYVLRRRAGLNSPGPPGGFHGLVLVAASAPGLDGQRQRAEGSSAVVLMAGRNVRDDGTVFFQPSRSRRRSDLGVPRYGSRRSSLVAASGV